MPGEYKRTRAGKAGLRGSGLDMMMPELRHRCGVPEGNEVVARAGEGGCEGVSRRYASQEQSDVKSEGPPLLYRCQRREN